MTPDQFVKDAVRTESRIEKVIVNPEVFQQLTTALISLGSILDQIKKHTFYKKPYDVAKLRWYLNSTASAVSQLQDHFQTTWPLPQTERAVEIDPRIFHSVVGIVTEGVELLEAIDLNKSGVDNVNLLEEFGDLNWYQAIGVDAVDGSYEQVLERVIAKLRVRYPEKFTSENAINRDLVKEREVLEGKS